MKKSANLPANISKASFFNDCSDLFCQHPAENTQFSNLGTYQMKFQKRLFSVVVETGGVYLKIREDKYEKYMNVENACLRIIIKKESTEFGVQICKNGMGVQLFGNHIDLIDKIKKYVIQSEFQQKYRLLHKIGDGYCSSVYSAQLLISGQKFAAKIVNKSILNKSGSYEREYVLNEINLLRQINHKNLLKLEEIHEGEQNIYIVTELLEAGSMKNYIIHSRFSEQECIALIHNLFTCLNYLHKLNIYHNEINLNNILLRDGTDFSSACLINFGRATQIPSKSHLFKYLESKDQATTINLCRKNDIYSLGIITLSIFTKKLYQEKQLLDELLMNNFQNVSDLEYMNLSAPLQRFFDIIFTDKYKKSIDQLTCETILQLDLFRITYQPRRSKMLMPDQLGLNLKRNSKFLPRNSTQEKLESQLRKLILPPINQDKSPSVEKGHSFTPKSERLIPNKLVQDLKASSFNFRSKLLKEKQFEL